MGKTTNRRVTRKAIQEVNVPKACEKIIHPGAPLALRLQGNLLYGVSRVFAQQCHYVLSDAEKTQSDMLTFFRVMQTSELDPKAGKAKCVFFMLFIFDPKPLLIDKGAIKSLCRMILALTSRASSRSSISSAATKNSCFFPARIQHNPFHR